MAVRVCVLDSLVRVVLLKLCSADAKNAIKEEAAQSRRACQRAHLFRENVRDMRTVKSLRDEERGVHGCVRQELNHISHGHRVSIVVEIFQWPFDPTVAPATRIVVFGRFARDGILSTRNAEVQILRVGDGPDNNNNNNTGMRSGEQQWCGQHGAASERGANVLSADRACSMTTGYRFVTLRGLRTRMLGSHRLSG